jgi:mono/diheme cytochrome c family protein
MMGRTFARMLVLSSAAAVAVLAGCSVPSLVGYAPPARRPNMIPAERLQDNPRLAEGQFLFMEHCNQCHVGGAAGVGPSLNDKPLPPWLIRIQVRHGFGAMPAYSSRAISDRELEDVITYVRYLRFHPNGPARS